MLSVFANMMNVATRQDGWTKPVKGPGSAAPDRRGRDEAERDRARLRRGMTDAGRL